MKQLDFFWIFDLTQASARAQLESGAFKDQPWQEQNLRLLAGEKLT